MMQKKKKHFYEQNVHISCPKHWCSYTECVQIFVNVSLKSRIVVICLDIRCFNAELGNTPQRFHHLLCHWLYCFTSGTFKLLRPFSLLRHLWCGCNYHADFCVYSGDGFQSFRFDVEHWGCLVVSYSFATSVDCLLKGSEWIWTVWWVTGSFLGDLQGTSTNAEWSEKYAI